MKTTRLFLLPLIVSLMMIIGTGDDALAQVKDRGPRYGQDSVKCVMEISLYREFFKQWKNSDYTSIAVADAVRHWRWVFQNCPMGTENTYLDGVKMYSYFIKEEPDNTRKELLIDTLMMIYDQRMEYFPNHYKTGQSQVGNILGRKGVDLYQWRPQATEEVFQILKRSVEMDGNNSQTAIIVYYFRTAIDLVNANTLGKDVLVELFDQLMEIVEYNIRNNPTDKEDFESVKANLELSVEPYATCADLIPIFRTKFDAGGDTNPELLKKIINMLDKKNCTADPLYFDATVKLYELEPDPESAFLIGRMLYKKNDYSKALQYLLQATDMADTNSRADCYLLLADAYRNLRDYPKSRSYAYKCAELRPGDGNPYIMIGDLYASSADACGDDEIGKKAAYWVAVDKYYKAKSVDPSLEQVANERIYSYSRGFPAIERIFFHDLKEGDSYTVGCWINETTTVRAAK
ncbi:MAG: tetratricopeptide repeat protein [Lentimicrobiaceae bacterium]|nr:tetratricopeptide repeat protein [Lentimicrobiaceae bacterium]